MLVMAPGHIKPGAWSCVGDASILEHAHLGLGRSLPLIAREPVAETFGSVCIVCSRVPLQLVEQSPSQKCVYLIPCGTAVLMYPS